MLFVDVWLCLSSLVVLLVNLKALLHIVDNKVHKKEHLTSSTFQIHVNMKHIWNKLSLVLIEKLFRNVSYIG